MNYDAFWQEMAAAITPTGSGRLQRRIHADISHNLFLGLERPSNQRMLIFEVADSNLPSEVVPKLTRGVDIRVARYLPAARTILEVRLVAPEYEDIFSALIGDLIVVVTNAASERDAAAMFIGRLRRWERFLETCGPQGLSEQAQRGLYGELWFIGEALSSSLGSPAIIASWTGPEASAHDFQDAGWAIEVKTTTTKLPQKLIISNERQLDDMGIAKLYIVHLSLDGRQGEATTLPAMVDRIRTDLMRQESAVIRFEDKLLAAGYLEEQKQLYERTGYIVRNINAFRVQEGFPRIIEAGLLAGVGDVKYSVAVAACMPFAVPMAEISKAVREAHG